MTRKRRFIWIGAFALMTAAVLISPLLLTVLSKASLPWTNLADVGQAYGGASALISAAALLAVGVSLVLQQGQARRELADLDRRQHAELINRALDDPQLLAILDGELAARPHSREFAYANSVMSYWFSLWDLQVMSDQSLRSAAGRLFYSPVARRWWEDQGRDGWAAGSERNGRFSSIVSDGLRTRPLITVRPRPKVKIATVVGCAAAGLLTAGIIRHTKNKR